MAMSVCGEVGEGLLDAVAFDAVVEATDISGNGGDCFEGRSRGKQEARQQRGKRKPGETHVDEKQEPA